jgi:hypothetical protein
MKPRAEIHFTPWTLVERFSPPHELWGKSGANLGQRLTSWKMRKDSLTFKKLNEEQHIPLFNWLYCVHGNVHSLSMSVPGVHIHIYVQFPSVGRYLCPFPCPCPCSGSFSCSCTTNRT